MSEPALTNAPSTPPQISAAPPAGYSGIAEAFEKSGFRRPTPAELADRFMHHRPVGDQADRYAKVRAAILAAALQIVELTPVSPEQTRALNALDEAMFLANAAIARHGKQPNLVECPNCHAPSNRVMHDRSRGYFTCRQCSCDWHDGVNVTKGYNFPPSRHASPGGHHIPGGHVPPTSGATRPETAQGGDISVDLARGPDIGCVVAYDFASKKIVPGKFVCDDCGAEYAKEPASEEWEWTRGYLMHNHKHFSSPTHFVPDNGSASPINISPSDADMAKV